MNSPRPARLARWILGALLVAAWVVAAGRLMPRPTGDLPKPDLTGRGAAAYEWTLRDVSGRAVDFATYRGRVVFLNLWSTRCGPCLEELPAIANLARNRRLKDVAFLCVATDAPADVRRFLDGPGQGMPMTFLVADDAPAPFLTDAIPATFILAPDGRIAVGQIGAAQWDDPDVIDLLASLLPRPKP